MVKFLSGGQFDGDTVPLCTFWRNDLTTDPDEELSKIESTGSEFANANAGQSSSIGDFKGQCIANAFFPKSTITCFNDGDCNGEGKCLPCSKYRSGGMKMAITHSPPPEVLKYFAKGLTDDEIKSPNLVRFPPSAANAITQDQLPYHILLRNIQAEVAKCCRWNADTGVAGSFFLATIQDGPDVITFVNSQGQNTTVNGIIVQNDAFPDEVGTFFPIGTVVVAGWEDQPSFFLEPRTGLIRPGDGIIYNFNSGEGVTETASTIRTKEIASDSNQVVTSAVQAAGYACTVANNEVARQSDFLNNAANTNDPQTIAAATAKYDALVAAATTSCDAANAAPAVGQDCIDLIADTINSPNATTLQTNGQALADKLTELADLVELAGSVVTGTAATQTARQVRLLRINSRTLSFSATGGLTRCEFFFNDENIAEAWNSPEDGSLPCNGVRTDCQFYTGKEWLYATDEKMGHGNTILAEQIQEIRFRSDNWARFADPEDEFRNRFTTPFVWAFKDYVDVAGEPDPADPSQMLLFRPKVIFGRTTSFSSYQQILMDQVRITDLTADVFNVSKSTARTQPGSESLDKDSAPPFPSLIAQPTVPAATRLQITHPSNTSPPFIYRMWTPDKNKITLFGTASPDQTIYIINRTALKKRLEYLIKFGERDFFDVPRDLPKAPGFVGLTATELLSITDVLDNEKATNLNTISPLGYDVVTSGRDGFWSSIQQVDLAHNEINDIYVFLIASETSILTGKTRVDCRFLHSIVSQDTFTGVDFTMNNIGPESKVGTNASDTTRQGEIKATARQLIGSSREGLSFDYGYFAWRFIDRGLQFGTLNADNDLRGQNPIADLASTFLVTEAAPSEFVVNVGYQVVEYAVTDFVTDSDDWSVIGDCGTILLKISDPNVNRVLPLPNQQGGQTPLTGILTNGGGTGSEIAQWGLTSATLTIGSEKKELIQFYRDADGFGIPANYVVLGPGPSAQDQFGRPDPTRDTLTVSYKFIRGQSAAQEGDAERAQDAAAAEAEEQASQGGASDTDAAAAGVAAAAAVKAEQDAAIAAGHDPDESPPALENVEAINTNFHNDSLRSHKHFISFDEGSGSSSNSFTFGGGGVDGNSESGGARISQDQQDYAFVFKDNEGRPLGKKYMRFYVMYYNLSCINVEIFYRWAAQCTTYALIPDLFLRIGDESGTVTAGPDATDDPNDPRLVLGFRVANLLGNRECFQTPSCGDHEFIHFGPLRREFEVIVNVTTGEGEDAVVSQKANFPSAGGPIEGPIVSSERPGSQFLRKHGPMWYPYTACERPRYEFNTYGPLQTDSTELINTTTKNPGLAGAASEAGFVVAAGVAGAQGGVGSGAFGPLPDKACEAYQGPNQVVPKILDIHPSLRACTSAYTYGNQISKAGENRFVGYARRRGVIDTFLYEGLAWTDPPFGNFGRPRLMFELSSERGDYVGGFNGKQVGRRWMPMFPTRSNISASSGEFSEDNLEHAAYRMVCASTPVGTITESVPTGSPGGGGLGSLTVLGAPRFTHKQIIGNKTAAAIEFPFSPYFPMFLPDGTTSKGGNVETPEGGILGSISTMWAWREAEKTVQRGTVGTNILKGISLLAPDYFIDNRRLEVELRPSEGNSTLLWTPPKYNPEDGEVLTNASLKLADGPAREIIIDFVNQTFGVEYQAGSLYDTSLQPCAAGSSDNPNMSATCVCISDITDPSLGAESNTLPSRFLHLDEIAPAGYLGLYSQSDLETPFLVDIPRSTNEQPCCMCTNYIPGLFFSLNGDHIPSVSDINPAFDKRLEPLYTWSRVPHGLGAGTGQDLVFDAFEQRGDELVPFNRGQVFTNDIRSSRGGLDLINDGGAIFPSQLEANTRLANGDPIPVGGWLDPNDPLDLAKLHGGIPAASGISLGETESITLAMVFNTYVKITEVDVTFYAGVGFEAPAYRLGLVQPQNRTNDLITTNTSLIVGQALGSSFESNVPDPLEELESDDIREGRAKFISQLIPSYAGSNFWDTYGMEWHLIFPARGVAQSMGIASISLKVDAITTGANNLETIGVRARRYYKSTGSPTSDNNPERFLSEMDSATVYWRSTETGSFKGDNRHRAYAWGGQITDNQNRIENSNVSQLEELQEKEYDIARSLLETPYEYNFTSFLPLDEERWSSLLSDINVSWTSKMSATISPISEISNQANQTPLYGPVPKRTSFNAPGHVWVHNFEETYTPCCFGCVHSMLVNYDFLHLHDNLAVVETAGFWSELPSGFTRLIRSTEMLPDPNFTGAEGGVGNVVLLNESDFQDPKGNAIPTDVLNAAGFTQDPTTGQYYVDGSEPNVGVGGPSGPTVNCGK